MVSIRQLLVVALVTAGIWALKRLQQHIKQSREAPPIADAARVNDFEEMVRCNRCGAHILRANAGGNQRQGFRCTDGNCLDRSDSVA